MSQDLVNGMPMFHGWRYSVTSKLCVYCIRIHIMCPLTLLITSSVHEQHNICQKNNSKQAKNKTNKQKKKQVRVTFTDCIFNANNQHSLIGMFLYPIQVKVGCFLISPLH